MIEVVKFDGEHADTVLAKQLFLHDKKKKENLWLVCAAADTEVDLKALNKHVKCSSGNLRAADADALEKYLGCRKGMVNYFSTINDVDKKVMVLFDKKLTEASWVSFHPMDNSASTCINQQGVQQIKELGKRDDASFEVLDFAALGGGAQKPADQKPAK